MTKSFIIRDFQGYHTLSGAVVGAADDVIVLTTARGPGEEPATVMIDRATIVGEFPTAA